uniref:U1-type domain-containing protein n=1 Tax=Magallana gigas TaxID=29159 RepID=K1PF14_MAGGI
MPSENPSFSSRTVLPPKSESSQYQKQGGKRPVERESAQSLIQSRKQAEKLQRDKEERQKRILALEEELTKLRRQQNEIMRKKRRQKDGHKDPILLQNSKLQEEIAMQISKLRKIGEGKSVEELQPQQKKSKTDKEEQKVVLSFQVKGGVKTRYEFFDPGKHWCKLCNTVYDTAMQFLEHTHFRHNKKVETGTNNYDRPWIPDQMKNPTPKKKAQKTEVVSLKGPEFLFPINGFFCVLCREFSGDVQCAEFHLKTDIHHSNYQKFLQDSPFYEQRRQLDRAKGLAEKQEKTLKDKESKPLFGKNISLVRERQIAKPVERNVNIKQSEKEVEELSDIQGSTQSNAAKLAKMKLSLKQPTVTNPAPKPEVEEPPALQTQSSAEEAEKTADGEKKEDGKKGIEIRIANKIGIIGKVPAKKNALLPPWTPVSRQEPLKSIAGLEAEKNKSANEKKQVTAQDILKAVQEKREQEQKEMEEKAKQEALLNVMEIPVPQEKPTKKEDIPIPEETPSKKEDIFVSEETPSKETRPEASEKTGNRGTMMADLSAIPVPSRLNPEVKDDTNVKNNSTIGSPNTQKAEGNSVASDNGNVKCGSNQVRPETIDKMALENIVMPESVTLTPAESRINNSPSVTVTLTKEKKDPPFQNENQSDLSKSFSLSLAAADTIKNYTSFNKDVSIDHSGEKADQPLVNSGSIRVTQSINVSVNIENSQDSNQEPLTGDSENPDVDDDKTISDVDDTIDLDSGDENTKDGEKFSSVQQHQCRPIEDVIDVSMGSLGDVVEVAVGGGGVGELEGDMDCSVEGLYGVIGGESENLDDVLSVGPGRRGAGCFSDLRPMDIGDMTTGMDDPDVGDIVSELMHSNGMDSGKW